MGAIETDGHDVAERGALLRLEFGY
jgi:hypothetical protein